MPLSSKQFSSSPHVPDGYYQKGAVLDSLGRSAEAQAAREKAQQLSGGLQSGGEKIV